MKNWKKAGVTALAGSLVALSAQAGEMSVSGGATLTYSANTGAQDSARTAATSALGKGSEGSRWGMNRTISASGSGEMDNGWTVTVSQSLANGGLTANSITLDMGDAGSLNYETSTGSRGIGKISDMLPTADEDAGNALDADGTGTGVIPLTTTVSYLSAGVGGVNNDEFDLADGVTGQIKICIVTALANSAVAKVIPTNFDNTSIDMNAEGESCTLLFTKLKKLFTIIQKASEIPIIPKRL